MSHEDAIYEVLEDEDAFARLPATIAGIVGARSMTFQIFSNGGPPEMLWSYFSDAMIAHYLENDLVPHDVWHGLAVQSGRFHRAFRASEYISKQDFLSSVMFNECFRHFGDDTGQCLGAIIPTQDGLISVGAHRALNAPGFEAAEQARLHDLLPHVRRVVRARERLRRAETGLLRTEAALETLASGVVLAEADGTVRFMNRAAEGIVSVRDGLAVRNGRLAAVYPAAAGRLERAISEAAGRRDGRGGGVRLERISGLPDYRAMVTPCVPPGGTGTLAMILIDDPAQAAPDIAPQVQAMFGLTAAEADLAMRLLRGETLEEAAEAREVKTSTVRSQLKTVMAKTDTRRQPELVALMARLPRLAGGDPSEP